MLGHFYYSRKRDLYLLTNDTGAYAFLSEPEFRNFIRQEMDPDSSKWGELEEKHFCSRDSLESYVRRAADAVSEGNRYLFEPTSLFIFAVTNACNNRCVYCQANGNSGSRHMSRETAETALRKIAESPASQITIEFQGGEPLMQYPLIEYIISRSGELLENKSVQFTVVSNLSLLTEEMADFFREYKVSVSTSLDGPAFIHDRNRPTVNGEGSFAAMMKGKEILNSRGIRPGAIETTTALSLRYPKEIVDTYAENGFSQLFLRPLTRLGAAARAWDTVGYKPEEFLFFYKEALDRILQYNLEGKKLTEYHAALFLSKILKGKAVNYMELRSPCGAGLGQMAFTADGGVYTCDEGRMMAEMGDESFRLGSVYDSGYNDWIESPACRAVCSASLLETIPGCCDCVYKPYCGVCPVVNYALNGNLVKNSGYRCRIYKGILDILFEYIREGNPSFMDIFSEWGDQV